MMMRALMIQNVTNDQLSAAIDNFATSPFPMDIHGEIALAAMYGERGRRRQNAPEFLVKVVDPCVEKLGEFSELQNRWIEGFVRLARDNAEKMVRRKEASNASIQAANRLTAMDSMMAKSKEALDDHLRLQP